MRPTLFTVPGYTGSGPQHWQSLWEAADPTIRRIDRGNWSHPDAEKMAMAIEAAVRGVGRQPIVLVAHSCGATAVAHWSARFNRRIEGAFLVAPPDSDDSALATLSFPTVVIASENDPHCTFDRAREFAHAWGATLISAGKAGHINTASGHGPWPAGWRQLIDFCAGLGHQAGGPRDPRAVERVI
jgi:predicted alpha/beta hydrolase family esterase